MGKGANNRELARRLTIGRLLIIGNIVLSLQKTIVPKKAASQEAKKHESNTEEKIGKANFRNFAPRQQFPRAHVSAYKDCAQPPRSKAGREIPTNAFANTAEARTHKSKTRKARQSTDSTRNNTNSSQPQGGKNREEA